MNKVQLALLPVGVLGSLAVGSLPSLAASGGSLPESPAPEYPSTPSTPSTPVEGPTLSTSAADLEATSNNQGSIENINSGRNENIFQGQRQVNIQHNSAFDSAYVKIGDISYPTPNLSAEIGAVSSSDSDQYWGNNSSRQDIYGKIQVTVPLGGTKLPRRIAKARDKRAQEKHCINAHQAGYLLDSCKDLGIAKVTPQQAKSPEPKVVEKVVEKIIYRDRPIKTNTKKEIPAWM